MARIAGSAIKALDGAVPKLPNRRYFRLWSANTRLAVPKQRAQAVPRSSYGISLSTHVAEAAEPARIPEQCSTSGPPSRRWNGSSV